MIKPIEKKLRKYLKYIRQFKFVSILKGYFFLFPIENRKKDLERAFYNSKKYLGSNIDEYKEKMKMLLGYDSNIDGFE